MVINPAYRNWRYSIPTLGLAILLMLGLVLSFLAGGDVPGASAKLANQPQSQPQAPLVTPTPAPCGLAWRQEPGPHDVWFQDVTVISGDNAWAVGGREANSLAAIAHWDGAQWTQVAIPNPAGLSNSLYSVDAVTADDIWAVGQVRRFSYRFEGVVMHYDGAQWTEVTVPNLPQDSRLTSVSALTTNDVWAVGEASTTGSYYYETFTLHWDGSTWTRIPSPIIGYGSRLESVHAIATNDVWAIGYTGSSGNENTLAVHWNGTAWSVVSTPNPSNYLTDILYDVTATASNDVWAVGSYQVGIGYYNYVYRPLLLHWDGTAWTQVQSPLRGEGSHELRGVTAISANDVWAVGSSQDTLYGGNPRTLTQHYDGAQWTIVDSPSPSTNWNYTSDVDAASSNDVWAVGAYTGQGTDALALRYSDPCTTPAPTSTVVLGTPTSTRTPFPTNTTSPTLTSAPTPTCGPGWQRINSPDPPGNYNQLSGVAVVAPNDVWAVGEYRANGSQLAYIEHWNGTAWSLVPAPNTGYSGLAAISAVSANDIWAVGYDNASGFFQPFTIHWNGTIWSEIPTPRPFPGSHGSLKGVGAVSSNDVWAVGDGPNGPLTMHWDGTQWTVIPSMLMENTYTPGKDADEPGSYSNSLFAVGVVSSNDVWAVGTRNGITWALRWNGTQWSQVSTPNPGNENSLDAITVIAPNDIWAVGHIGFYLHPQGAIALHWNGTTWTSVPPPAGNFGLFGVTALSSNEVWAVGWQEIGQYSSDAVIFGWNGTQWTRVPSPNPTYANRDELFATDAAGPGDVWAVGMFDYDTLIDRYYEQSCGTPAPTNTVAATATNTQTRTATRTAGPSVTPDPCAVTLNGSITSTDPTQNGRLNRFPTPNACGSTRGCPGIFTLYGARHYDQYTLPNATGSTACVTVNVNTACTGTQFIFAAAYLNTFDPNDLCANYIGDINGSPNPTGTMSFDVPAGQNLVLVVHEANPSAGCPAYTMTVSGLGGSCPTPVPVTGTVTPTNTPAPPPPSTTSIVTSTATACPGLNISGALTLQDPTQAGRLNTLTQASTCAAPRNCPGVLETIPRHYDAYAFRNTSSSEACFTVDVTAACLNSILIHSSAYLGSFDPSNLCQNYLADVGPGVLTNSQYSFTVPAGQTFVVVVNEIAPNLLCPNYTLSVSGPACPVPTTPVPTSTSILPTVTSILPTVTGVPTAVACSIRFSDVTSSNTFYRQIMCLSCMGFTSGYSDGTFRPDNSVTRGQLSKIVANSAGFSNTPTQQTFQDVEVGSTFYMYIERMASTGIISGYPCGGVGEPCGTGNKPYFRPNANVTRGQISKIVSNASGLSDAANGQTFDDVSPNHPFYLWVQRLVQHGMMSGYPCGGAGEPCGADGRLYFRPSNSATRGQVSKIVGNGFYPNCATLARVP